MSTLDAAVSSDELALICEIAEHPRDLTARFIYADWLEERGDARGTFVRLHCAAASAPDLERRQQLESQARVLLNHHGDAWLARLGPGVGAPTYRLGLIDDVPIQSAALIKTRGRALTLAPITGLTVRLSGAELEAFGSLTALQSIRRLRLDYSELGDGRLLLEGPCFPPVRELSVAHCLLGPLGVSRLAHHPKMSNLERLVLTGNGPGVAGLQAIARSRTLSKLRQLILDDYEIPLDGAVALRHSPFLPQLNTLHVSHVDRDVRAVLQVRFRLQ